MEQSPNQNGDRWYQRQWRPICAFLYMIICLSDFVIMPIMYEKHSQVSPAMLKHLKELPVETQPEFIRTILAPRTWTPLTLQGGGLFHLSFGAILTGAAYTRGLEKIEKIRRNGGN